MEHSVCQERYFTCVYHPVAETIGDTLNDFDEILAEHFSPEAVKSGSRNSNIDSLDFENSDDLNNIIEKYETMLRLEPASKSQKPEVK